MNYLIRPIEKTDIASFNQAVGSVVSEKKYLAFLKAPSMEMTKAFVEKNIEGKWPHLVVVHNHSVIGWCDITSLHREAFAHAGTLGIGVMAAYRGKGIGKNLMQQALDKAKEKGLTRVELTVREHNKNAIRLYQKMGFQQEGLHINAVNVDGVYENLISMAILFE